MIEKAWDEESEKRLDGFEKGELKTYDLRGIKINIDSISH